MVRMSSDLRLKKDVELSLAAYLKFHSVFNGFFIDARNFLLSTLNSAQWVVHGDIFGWLPIACHLIQITCVKCVIELNERMKR